MTYQKRTTSSRSVRCLELEKAVILVAHSTAQSIKSSRYSCNEQIRIFP